MSAPHSRGPWHARDRSTRTKNLGVYNANGILLASLDVHQLAREAVFQRRIADARVMAAAPALLESLRWAMGFVPQPVPAPTPVHDEFARNHAAAVAALSAADPHYIDPERRAQLDAERLAEWRRDDREAARAERGE